MTRDAGVPARTVREYVSVLVDTLVAVAMEPWGTALEHLVFHELRAWRSYVHGFEDLNYWRTVDQRGLRDLATKGTFRALV